MNKFAVALAADSAVTVRETNSSGSKIRNSAYKVFALSKSIPVGIMISGEASVMGIPWETVIKSFRAEIKSGKCDTIDAYCERFFCFVDAFPFDQASKKQYILRVARFIFTQISQHVNTWVNQELQKGELQANYVLDYLRQVISEVNQFYSRESTRIGILKNSEIDKIFGTYCADIHNEVDKVFGKYNLHEDDILKLCYATMYLVSSNTKNSEIVVAGFGEKEHFPCCRTFDVGGVIGQHTIRVKTTSCHDVGPNKPAVIVPIAQQYEVRTFLDGISPHLSDVVEGYFQTVFSETGSLPGEVFRGVSDRLGLQQDRHHELENSLRQICQGAYEAAMLEFKEEREKRASRFIEMTRFLNKDELAQMAETLVLFESFRQQIASNEETVGGPIDVAVITKGDGLIWIKRKKYFDADLNQHYFRK